MTVAAFHKSFACRSEGHCTSCRGDAGWRARIGPKYGIPVSDTPWRCRKDSVVAHASGTMYQSAPLIEPTIPRIMHFVWVQGEPPEWAKAIMAYWQKVNPAYQLMLHDESAVAPEHQHIFDTVLKDNSRISILCKADIIRVDVLRRHGGWHIDMDFMPLATLDEIWQAFKPKDFMCLRHWRVAGGRDTLCNGLMCGTVDSPVWPLIEEAWKEPQEPLFNYYSTGTLHRIRKNPAVYYPKSPSHFFPSSYQEGAPCIRLAEELLTGRSSMKAVQSRLSCCGAPKPYAFHIGMRGGVTLNLKYEAPRDTSLAPVTAFMRSAESTIKGIVKNPMTLPGYTQTLAALKQPGNVILWGGNWDREAMASFKANAIFVENGLINQSAGFYVDGGGYNSDSQLCKQRLWEHVVEDRDIARVKQAVKGWGWEWGQGGDPNGPIIVALQRRLDTGCYRFFPKNTVRLDPVDSLLEYCAKYLPKNRKVLIRPHPRYKTEWEAKRKEYVAKHFQPNWEVNLDGGIYPMLLQASALVTVNSTVASEAMALNIPIATLGEGVWTGSDATLECAQDPAKLAGILDAKPDMERRMAVQSAILRRQVRYGDTAAFAKHPAYLDWLNRLQ